jgi:hypothetical protein
LWSELNILTNVYKFILPKLTVEDIKTSIKEKNMTDNTTMAVMVIAVTLIIASVFGIGFNYYHQKNKMVIEMINKGIPAIEARIAVDDLGMTEQQSYVILKAINDKSLVK